MRESRDENEGMGPLTKSELIIPNIRTENVNCTPDLNIPVAIPERIAQDINIH